MLHFRRRVGLALALGLALGASISTTGCATVTGIVTGAFTGAVDAPAEVYRHNEGEFHRNPIYWAFNVLFFVPVGIAAGPVVGAGKGLALDVEWLIDEQRYGPVFGSYREPSVWRPYTIRWH
jgi:predicted Kef-type K+ transport protein